MSAAAAGDGQRAIWSSRSYLSILHYCQRRVLPADDADGHFALEGAGHSAGGGLVRCGARTNLATVVVTPRVHLADVGLKR